MMYLKKSVGDEASEAAPGCSANGQVEFLPATSGSRFACGRGYLISILPPAAAE